MSSVHSVANERLCRICTRMISRESKDHMPCENHHAQIEEFYKLYLEDSDPTYICFSCISYMKTCMKRHVNCKSFVKRIWQNQCEGVLCDTCMLYNRYTTGGRPRTVTFKSMVQMNTSKIVPLGDMYSYSCGVCFSALSKDSKVLPCGHIQCSICTNVFSDGKVAKCGKCSVTWPISEIQNPCLGLAAMLLHHTCKCKVCNKSGF
jgi:hypothetical protein